MARLYYTETVGKPKKQKNRKILPVALFVSLLANLMLAIRLAGF